MTRQLTSGRHHCTELSCAQEGGKEEGREEGWEGRDGYRGDLSIITSGLGMSDSDIRPSWSCVRSPYESPFQIGRERQREGEMRQTDGQTVSGCFHIRYDKSNLPLTHFTLVKLLCTRVHLRIYALYSSTAGGVMHLVGLRSR